MKAARVHACTGAPAAGRMRSRVARALERGDLGDVVVAIDGCSSACIRRSLEAIGLHPLAVTLEELGVAPEEEVRGARADALRDAIVDRLKAQARSEAAPRRLRRATSRPGVKATDGRGHTSDDYLFAIHLLTSPVASCGSVVADWPTTAARVAEALSVTRVSAGEALARLEASRHIARGPAKEVLLTRKGRSAVRRLVRRHRVVERFLVDILGCSAAESYELALGVRDALPPAVMTRIEPLVAPSSRCPHGWPLEPAEDADFARDLVAVSALPVGATGTVTALAEGNADVLGRLFARGIEPGGTIAVRGHKAGATVVSIDSRRHVVDADDAAAILVALAETGPSRTR